MFKGFISCNYDHNDLQITKTQKIKSLGKIEYKKR